MPLSSRAFLQGPPLSFGHRGGAALWPENTLEAFRGALGLGMSVLETDLHATADGVLVCHHDARVDRTTNGSGYLRQLDLETLRRLDAGYRFTKDGVSFPERNRGHTIPTLEEVVALGPDVRLNVEVKQSEPDITAALSRFLTDRGLEDRFLVAGEQDGLVRRFRRESRGRVATSAGRRETQLFWAAARAGLSRVLPIAYDALQVPEWSGRLRVVDGRFVHAAHARGLQVHVWTVNEATDMRRLLDLGVDGIMTDRPDILAQTLSA